MTHYNIYCPLCGADSVARVNGAPTDLVDGYTFCRLDGYAYIHEKEEKQTTMKDMAGRK